MPRTKKAAAPERTLAAWYVDFLAGEGYRPDLEPDEDDPRFSVVRFKSEGTKFLLFAYEDDPEFFSVACGFDLGEGELDRETLATVAAEVNDGVKGVKCTFSLDGRMVRFQVESFLCGAKASGALLARSLGALRHAADQFFEKRLPPEHLDA